MSGHRTCNLKLDLYNKGEKMEARGCATIFTYKV